LDEVGCEEHGVQERLLEILSYFPGVKRGFLSREGYYSYSWGDMEDPNLDIEQDCEEELRILLVEHKSLFKDGEVPQLWTLSQENLYM